MDPLAEKDTELFAKSMRFMQEFRSGKTVSVQMISRSGCGKCCAIKTLMHRM
jgi:hypothetical protein